MDREKVIKEFEKICEYTLRPHEFRVLNDVLSLLKEQETVEPILTDQIVIGVNRKCSKCNDYIFPAGRYCPHCGMPVRWEDD